MADPENYGLLSEAGLFIIREGGEYLVTEDFISAGGGKAKPQEIEKDTSELWEIGASIYSINDNVFRNTVKTKKYIMQENDIKVTIEENIFLQPVKIINENVTAKLLSNIIKE